MMITVFSFLALFFSNNFIKANILVEPYLGMAFFGEGDLRFDSEKDTLEYSGLFLGSRLGYEYLGLMLGADYGVSSFDLQNSKISAIKDKVRRTDLGLVLGYKFPILLRIWAKWILQSTIEGNKNKTSEYFPKNATYEGSGQSFGIGWTGVPYLSFNFEYRFILYEDAKFNDINATNYHDKLDLRDFFVSVSIPITF